MRAYSFQWRRLLHVLPLLAGLAGVTAEASAAELFVKEWRGHRVLLLSGAIEDGTAEKLAAALTSVEALPYDLPVLLLDSLGGSVDEAMKISALLD